MPTLPVQPAASVLQASTATNTILRKAFLIVPPSLGLAQYQHRTAGVGHYRNRAVAQLRSRSHYDPAAERLGPLGGRCRVRDAEMGQPERLHVVVRPRHDACTPDTVLHQQGVFTAAAIDGLDLVAADEPIEACGTDDVARQHLVPYHAARPCTGGGIVRIAD